MRKKIAQTIILSLLFGFSAVRTIAQHDLTLYNMQMVPQRIFQNPSFIPENRFYIGIPVLSGIQSSFAMPFSYNNVFERGADDSLTLKVDDALAKLDKNGQIRIYNDIEVLSLGTRIAKGRFFLGFSIRERICQHILIPADLGNLVWYGNASSKLFGKEVNIAPAINIMAFDEYGASFSGYAMKKKLTWGVRLKYLAGRVDATTVKSSFTVQTNTTNYQLNMRSDVEMRSSGIEDIENYLDQPVSSLVFPKNSGVGFDLGLNYQINDKINVSASVLDIGFIKWKANTMDLVSHNPGEEFAFKGVTLSGFISMLDSLDHFGIKMKDSIFDLIDIDSVYNRSYTSWLPVRFNVGGSYSLNEHHRFNLLLNGVSWRNAFHPALSVSYNYTLKRILGIMVSYNIFNRQYTNIGFGFNINAGPVQLYLVTDNVPALITYKGSNNYSLQFGINIALKARD